MIAISRLIRVIICFKPPKLNFRGRDLNVNLLLLLNVLFRVWMALLPPEYFNAHFISNVNSHESQFFLVAENLNFLSGTRLSDIRFHMTIYLSTPWIATIFGDLSHLTNPFAGNYLHHAFNGQVHTPNPQIVAVQFQETRHINQIPATQSLNPKRTTKHAIK